MISVVVGGSDTDLTCALHEIEHLGGLAVVGVHVSGRHVDMLLFTSTAVVVILTLHVSRPGTLRPSARGLWTLDGTPHLFAAPDRRADRAVPARRAAGVADAVRAVAGQGPGRPRIDALLVVSGPASLAGGTQRLTDVWVCQENDLAGVITGCLPRQYVNAAAVAAVLTDLGMPYPTVDALRAEGFDAFDVTRHAGEARGLFAFLEQDFCEDEQPVADRAPAPAGPSSPKAPDPSCASDRGDRADSRRGPNARRPPGLDLRPCAAAAWPGRAVVGAGTTVMPDPPIASCVKAASAPARTAQRAWTLRFALVMLAAGIAMVLTRDGLQPATRVVGLAVYGLSALLTSWLAARVILSADRRPVVLVTGTLGIGLLALASWAMLEALG